MINPIQNVATAKALTIKLEFELDNRDHKLERSNGEPLGLGNLTSAVPREAKGVDSVLNQRVPV